MNKVCIVGAGAIGGWLGTRLVVAGHCEVSALARGATLQALRTAGWRLSEGERELTAPAQAEEDAARLGRQDLVIIAVKGPAMRQVAAQIAPLIGPHTLLLPAMNGVPWWFPAATPALAGAPLNSVDPGGELLRALPLDQVLGCVLHASTTQPGPGRVRHRMGQGVIVGEPLGGLSARAQCVAQLLAQAGFEAPCSADIRRELWYKLWGNLTMNPVSALTGATVDRILADPALRAFCSAVMAEAAAIGERLGCPIEQDAEARHAVTERLGAFKTSMLQDVEAGRAIEFDNLLGAVHEMALRLQVPVPQLSALLGLTRVFAQQRGLYP